MASSQSTPFTGRDGLSGRIESRDAATADLVLEDGRRLRVASDLLEQRPDGNWFLSLAPWQLPPADSSAQSQIVLPVVEEELQLRARKVQAGVVRVSSRTHTRQKRVDLKTVREEVEISRIPIGRAVDVPPEVRREGDTLIVPVLEEVLVIEKKLFLREEVRLTTRRHESHELREVPLRHQEVTVERITNEPERDVARRLQ